MAREHHCALGSPASVSSLQTTLTCTPRGGRLPHSCWVLVHKRQARQPPLPWPLGQRASAGESWRPKALLSRYPQLPHRTGRRCCPTLRRKWCEVTRSLGHESFLVITACWAPGGLCVAWPAKELNLPALQLTL